MKRALALLAIPAAAAFLAAQESSVFRSETMGIEITKPAAWFYFTAQENNDNLRNLKMKDAAYQSAILNRGAVPLVAFSKYRVPHVGVNPTAGIWAHPAQGFKGRPATDVLKTVAANLRKSVKDFQVTHGPEAMWFQQHEAAYMQTVYTLETKNGFSAPILAEYWAIPRGEYIFLVDASMRWENNPQLREELSTIVNSIKIAP